MWPPARRNPQQQIYVPFVHSLLFVFRHFFLLKNEHRYRYLNFLWRDQHSERSKWFDGRDRFLSVRKLATHKCEQFENSYQKLNLVSALRSIFCRTCQRHCSDSIVAIDRIVDFVYMYRVWCLCLCLPIVFRVWVCTEIGDSSTVSIVNDPIRDDLRGKYANI